MDEPARLPGATYSPPMRTMVGSSSCTSTNPQLARLRGISLGMRPVAFSKDIGPAITSQPNWYNVDCRPTMIWVSNSAIKIFFLSNKKSRHDLLFEVMSAYFTTHLRPAYARRLCFISSTERLLDFLSELYRSNLFLARLAPLPFLACLQLLGQCDRYFIQFTSWQRIHPPPLS